MLRLRNPAHDAEDIANVLQGLGFTVQTKTNANQREMEEAVKEFVQKIQNGDVGLFYFSGHGVQVHGENYLIPVGGSIESESDVTMTPSVQGYILGEIGGIQEQNQYLYPGCLPEQSLQRF